MDHRSSDTSDVHVSFERKIPLTWVVGGMIGAAISLSIGFGAWAWNISLVLNNVSRDLAQVKDDVKDMKAAQKDASAEISKGIARDSLADRRMDDIERRLTYIETRPPRP